MAKKKLRPVVNYHPKDLVVVKYDAVQKEVDGTPDVVVANVYNLMEVLNECMDDYHERHKHG